MYNIACIGRSMNSGAAVAVPSQSLPFPWAKLRSWRGSVLGAAARPFPPQSWTAPGETQTKHPQKVSGKQAKGNLYLIPCLLIASVTYAPLRTIKPNHEWLACRFQHLFSALSGRRQNQPRCCIYRERTLYLSPLKNQSLASVHAKRTWIWCGCALYQQKDRRPLLKRLMLRHVWQQTLLLFLFLGIWQ